MKPYACPICGGRGVVPQGFYNPYPDGVASDTAPDQCRTCVGAGIVWGNETTSEIESEES